MAVTKNVYTNATYTLTLRYYANGGGTVPEEASEHKTTSSSSVTVTKNISETIPTRTGYTFLGYAYSASGSVEKQAGQEESYTFHRQATLDHTQRIWIDGVEYVTNYYNSKNQKEYVDLYAVWAVQTYTISYNANGGTGAPSAQTKAYGTTLTLSSTRPTRANSSAGSFTVTYNANGGTVSPASASASRTTSYDFTNWNTAAGGGGTSYSPGGSYTANASATLYAQWATSTSIGVVILPTPTRSGYNFSGWYTASSGGTKVGNGGSPYSPSADITLYAHWDAQVVAPTFTTQPSSKTVYRGASASLSVVATTTQGTITYQWQSSSNNSTWSNISGATSSSYSAPTSTVGTVYYRCVATATKSGVSKSTNSSSASVVVNATPVPTFTTQPSSKSVYVSGTASLSVTATVASGTLSYQWQTSSNNSTWSNISGATSSSYSAPTSTPGTKYYRCVATNTLNGYTTTKESSAVSVVVSVAPPTITVQPSNKDIYKGAQASLSITATAPKGTLSYQWQSSSNNSTWSNISGATSSSYSAPTSTVGTVYYRCAARATYSSTNSSWAYSNSCYVKVNDTTSPIIVQQPANVNAFVGETGKNISVTATVASGTLSYQWQSSTNGSSFSNISGATSANYTVPTSSASTRYYRCVVTNTLNGYTSSVTSSSAKVVVSAVTAPVFTTMPVSAQYSIGTTANKLTVSATSNGTITYQWQSSSNNSTWSNISGQTSSSYRPPTSTAGTKYYRCVATSTGGTQTQSANSNSASIKVIQATAPVFLYDLSAIDRTYNAGDVASAINGTAIASNGTITYQWYKSTDGGSSWYPISGATNATYTPETIIGGTAYYRVVATNTVGTSSVSATSNAAKITVANVILDYDAKWSQYINSIGKPFIKLARLDFLQPNGSVLFSLDNNPLNKRSGAFIQEGSLSVNLQNGARRVATVTLSNLDGEYDYNVNKLWFGQQVRLWEGMILPSGHDFYISQGVFYVKDPNEVYEPGQRTTTLNLVDKWSYLDGSLFGNLDGTMEVPLNSNIFNVIQSILNMGRGNGQKIDASVPVFTNYYNGKTTTLPDGTIAPLTNTPYTYRCDGENGTYADVILEMNTMLAGWIGYDANGQLRLDPSQDDILDTTKPVQWQFSPTNSTFLGATYLVKNSEVYNDIIIVGESLSEYGQTAGRATNYDPKSDTNANIVGLKTKRYQQAGYYTQDICESLAVFKLKRESVLKKSVSIRCSQLFHIQENNLVTIERTDKKGNPIERHLITGYTRPIAQNGEMVINATSVMDWPVATITAAP